MMNLGQNGAFGMLPHEEKETDTLDSTTLWEEQAGAGSVGIWPHYIAALSALVVCAPV